MKGKKKYEALREELESFILTHNLQQFDKLPTVREILKGSRYSYATLNRTLLEMERDGIISKHQGKGLFVNRLPRSSETPKQVALIIPKDFSAHKIFLDILAGVREVLEQARIDLLVQISNMSHEREKEAVGRLLAKHVDGMIISLEDHYRTDYGHIAELKERKFPFVLIDRLIPELETDYVGIDNEGAMLRVVSYLKYHCNCSDVVFIPSNDSSVLASSSDEKRIGYQKAMMQLYGNETGTVLSLDEFTASVETLSQSHGNIGVCLNHDTMIPDLLRKLREAQISLPENAHIFGYNNSYEKPYFPTVEQFNDKVGTTAAQLLLAKMKNPNREPVQVRIKPRLLLPDGQGGYAFEPWCDQQEGND